MAEGDIDNNLSTSPNSRSNPTHVPTNENISKLIIRPQSQLVANQLDETNFLLWKFQVLTSIKGYGLEPYTLGTKMVPDQHLPLQEFHN